MPVRLKMEIPCSNAGNAVRKKAPSTSYINNYITES